MPYAFTEQGIYMLMSVLKGPLAVAQSKTIVRLFKDMKDYIASENQQLLGCSNCVQIATLTAQHSHEIAEIRSDFNVFKNETQESLGKVNNCLQNTWQNGGPLDLLPYVNYILGTSKIGMLPDHRLISFGPKFII